jgi:hypothetical protein
VVSTEARNYIQIGRNSTYEFIDLLYRTDWKFDKKHAASVKVFYLQLPNEDLQIRCETKFSKISVKQLVEYFLIIDKRMAWEGSHLYASIEEVKSYPLNTSLYYFKQQQRQWLTSVQDLLLLTHGV